MKCEGRRERIKTAALAAVGAKLVFSLSSQCVCVCVFNMLCVQHSFRCTLLELCSKCDNSELFMSEFAFSRSSPLTLRFCNHNPIRLEVTTSGRHINPHIITPVDLGPEQQDTLPPLSLHRSPSIVGSRRAVDAHRFMKFQPLSHHDDVNP